jgi:cyclopropane fatty-acyl-phospholipid synthase-like methyltransferase
MIMSKGNIYSNGTYLTNNPSWHQEDSPWKAKQIAKIIQNNNIHPKTICEIGCGAGEILNCLSDIFDSKVVLSGYEISPQAFELCKSKQKHNLSFTLQDLFDEKDSTFDILMAIDVFEHVEDYIGFLKEFRKKGTYKIFHIPLDLSVQTVLRSTPILKERQTAGHIHYFTKETALATLKDTGYEIVDYFYTNSSIDLPNRGWKANLLKLPREVFSLINKDISARILGGFSLLVIAK